MICIAVGSQNQTKTNAAKTVFESQFVGNDNENVAGRRISKSFSELKACCYEIESIVSATPESDHECIVGATHRAKVPQLFRFK